MANLDSSTPRVAFKEDDDLYAELWKACAGPLVDIPPLGQRVYYFPQGHLEQLQSSINHEIDDKIPLFNLPSKILCRVMHVHLLAEHDTDEVYAQITLLPEEHVSVVGNPNSSPKPLISIHSQQSEILSLDPCSTGTLKSPVASFSKILTASDTSTHGGFSVLRKHATECLPPLDMSHATPSQELVARDLLGYEWRFKHIFRGQPRRHLLTTGWSTFVTSKRLVAGDAFIFLRGENGDLRVGVRRLARQPPNLPSSVISSQSMHLGILATASHAVKTQTLFVVYYKPRSSQFIVGLNAYLNGVGSDFAPGTRFRMKLEGDEASERKHTGTIVETGEISSQWKLSKWRCLSVQWDEPAPFPRPIRVSPWEIEPFDASPNCKKPRVEIPVGCCKLFGVVLTAKESERQPTRTRTKVQMKGVALGRAVDLGTMNGYDELMAELQKMFVFEGALFCKEKWSVMFADDVGDVMPVGVEAWP